MSNIKKIFIIFSAFASGLFMSLVSMPAFADIAAGSSVYSASMSAPDSVNIPETGVITPTQDATLYTSPSNLTFTSTCPKGSSISLSTKSATNSLLNVGDNSIAIAPTTTVLRTPATSANLQPSTGSPLVDNSWGISLDSGNTFAQVPASGNPVKVFQSNAAEGPLTIPMLYGVKINNQTNSGTYSTDVIYTLAVSGECLTYPLTFDPAGGTIANTAFNYNPQNLNYGQSINLSNYTPVRTGYVFSGWTATYTKADGSVSSSKFVGSETNLNLNPDNSFSVMLKANWSLRKLTLNSKSKQGTVTGSGTYEWGKPVTATFTPKSDWIKFLGWNDGTKYVSTDPVYTFNMPNADLSLSADVTVDYTKITDIKVLNIYPTSGYDQLKGWMQTYGKGIIKVDTVLYESFRTNPSAYLGTSGNWKYDVIIFGFRDCFYNCTASGDLSDSATTLAKQFIDEGNAVLFGHDVINSNHPNFDKAAYQLGNDPSYTGTSEYNGITGIGFGANTGYKSKVKIMKESVFTTYPYNIGKVGTIIETPASHSSQCITKGESFLRYYDSMYTDADMTSCTNNYLIVNDRTAMIQTGHSSGTADDNEEKILANIIFYVYMQVLDNKL